jgi:hypothetical protein
MADFTKIILYTDCDGRAKFREEQINLSDGKPQAMLSALLPAVGCQFRQNPVGFRSKFHCTDKAIVEKNVAGMVCARERLRSRIVHFLIYDCSLSQI